MSGPWDEYATPSAAKAPWEQYGGDKVSNQSLGDLVAPKPAAQPQSYPQRLMQGGMNILQGGMQGGPMGAVGAGGAEAMKGMGDVGHWLGGNATDLSAKAGLPPEVSAGIGTAADILPGMLVGGGGGRAAAPLLENAGVGMMQRALKGPTDEIIRGNAERAARTMLERGENVTAGGIKSMRGDLGAANQEAAAALRGSNATVSSAYPGIEVAGVRKKFSKQANPEADVGAVENSWSEFRRNWPKDIPIELAQEIKQGTYGALKGKFGEQGSAAVESQKAMARGLREGIEHGAPGVVEPNARASSLANALNIAEPAVANAAKKDPIGWGWLNPITLPMSLLDRSPLAKSILARTLYSGAKPAATGMGAVGGEAYGLNSGTK